MRRASYVALYSNGSLPGVILLRPITTTLEKASQEMSEYMPEDWTMIWCKGVKNAPREVAKVQLALYNYGYPCQGMSKQFFYDIGAEEASSIAEKELSSTTQRW